MESQGKNSQSKDKIKKNPTWIWYEIAEDNSIKEFKGSIIWHSNWQKVKTKQFYSHLMRLM